MSPPRKTHIEGNPKKKENNTIQMLLSEWVTDDDATHSQLTRASTPPLSQIPVSQSDMQSPILSPPIERSSSHVNINSNSTISNALNIAASAASLKKRLRNCEQIMTEKHKFLVNMLDGMNNKVSSIAENISASIRQLEEAGNTQTLVAQSYFRLPMNDIMTLSENR